MNLLHGYELEGKSLKVEPIKDTQHGRIRVPLKIVDYAVGPVKRHKGKGELNTMRRATATTGRTRMDCDNDDDYRVDRYRHDRVQRGKRKTRGRYKNQQNVLEW